MLRLFSRDLVKELVIKNVKDNTTIKIMAVKNKVIFTDKDFGWGSLTGQSFIIYPIPRIVVIMDGFPGSSIFERR